MHLTSVRHTCTHSCEHLDNAPDLCQRHTCTHSSEYLDNAPDLCLRHTCSHSSEHLDNSPDLCLRYTSTLCYVTALGQAQWPPKNIFAFQAADEICWAALDLPKIIPAILGKLPGYAFFMLK